MCDLKCPRAVIELPAIEALQVATQIVLLIELNEKHRGERDNVELRDLAHKLSNAAKEAIRDAG